MVSKIRWACAKQIKVNTYREKCDSDTYGAKLKLMIAPMFNQVMCVGREL